MQTLGGSVVALFAYVSEFLYVLCMLHKCAADIAPDPVTEAWGPRDRPPSPLFW